MATTMKLIAKNVLGSDTASVSFSSIPGTYTDLLIVTSARGTSTGLISVDLDVKINSSNANNSYRLLAADASSVSSYSASSLPFTGRMTTASATADSFSSNEVYIPNYAGSTNKSLSLTGVATSNSTSATAQVIHALAGLVANTSAVTSVSFTPGTGNFAAGSSFFLYGITKA